MTLHPLPLVFFAPYPWLGAYASWRLWRRHRKYRAWYDQKLASLR